MDSDLAVGDKIKFVRGGEDLFDQEVVSIQIENEKKDRAKKGDIIGLQTKEQVKEGAEVFRLT